MIENCFEKIINNYLENSYLTILLDVKDPRLALLIIFKGVDMALSNKLCDNNTNNFNERLSRYVSQMHKQIMSIYSEKVKSYNEDYSTNIPLMLYKLNFDIYKIFNEFDNKLLIGTIILKKDLVEIARILKTDVNIVIERYSTLLNQLKRMFYERIRSTYLKDIGLE